MKLLITGAWSCTQEQLNYLKNYNNEILFMQNEMDELPDGYRDVEGVIGNSLFLHHDIKKFTNLKYIQLTSAGFDRLPMEYIKERGITVYNAKGVYSVPMAEFAVCGVLDIYKQSRFFAKNQLVHKWEKHRGLLELLGKNVLIIGCGDVGTECAKRFRAFGCNVNGIDLVLNKNTQFNDIFDIGSLDEKLSLSDIVILTAPLTELTKGLFDRDRFNKMKHNSVLVNIARGAILNEQCLIDALKTKLLGAVLDVFQDEPLSSDSELWDFENVIITPHNSFIGEGNNERLANVIIKNIKRW